MTISSPIVRLEAILNSKAYKIYCALEQHEYFRILSGCLFFIHPVPGVPKKRKQ